MDTLFVVLVVLFIIFVMGFIEVLEMVSVRRQYARNRFLKYLQTEWPHRYTEIVCRPVAATSYGSVPHSDIYRSAGRYGALGVADGALIFMPQGSRSAVTLSADAIRWIGTRKIMVQRGTSYVTLTALMIHFQHANVWPPATWSAVAYVTSHAESVGDALSEITGLSLIHMGSRREDFGPESAAQLSQDVYGQWHLVTGEAGQTIPLTPDCDTERHRHRLYLAPDRLIYHWRIAIPFDRMRQVEVYQQGVLSQFNLFSEDLLRIEYTTPEGDHATTGFLLRRGPRWAEAFRDVAGLTVPVHTGRKKK